MVLKVINTPQPLTSLSKGAKAKIVSINAGRGLTYRLMQMGLTPGTVIEVIENSSGPLIISVRDVTIALGRGMAGKILVEPT